MKVQLDQAQGQAPVTAVERLADDEVSGKAVHKVTARVGPGGAAVWVMVGTRDPAAALAAALATASAMPGHRLVAHGRLVSVEAASLRVELSDGRTIEAHNFSTEQRAAAAQTLLLPGVTMVMYRYDTGMATYGWVGATEAQAAAATASSCVAWNAEGVPFLCLLGGQRVAEVHAVHPLRTLAALHTPVDVVWTRPGAVGGATVDAFAPRWVAARGDAWADTRPPD